MALDAKQILEVIGLSEAEAESPEALVGAFESRYIKRDQKAIKDDPTLYNGITGAYNESNKQALKRTLKNVGFEITGKDLEGKNIGDVIESILPTTFKSLTAEIETLKANASKGTNEKVAEIQSAFENYKKEHEPKISGYDTLKSEFETFKSAKEKEMLDFKIGQRKDAHWQKFPWAEKIDPFAKSGFINHVNQNYGLTLDENGNEIPTDKDGNPIKDPTKAGAYKSFAQILEEEGKKANENGARIFAVAKKENQPLNFGQKKEIKIQQENDQPVGRKINRSTRVNAG